MAGLADRAAGSVAASTDLSIWHDLQRWIALGPDDAVVPFARQIAAEIQPLMVRFRRDVGSLFSLSSKRQRSSTRRSGKWTHKAG